MPDLHFGATEEATYVEMAGVDAVIADLGPAVLWESERVVYGGRERARERRHLLLPVVFQRVLLRCFFHWIQ